MVKKRVGITVRFTVEDLQLIRETAKLYDISEADLIRMAVKEFLRTPRRQ
jgi:Ribbon-helix-helix protein, copG family.